MRFISYVIVLSTFIITVKLSILTNLRDNVYTFLKRSLDSENDEHLERPYHAKHKHTLDNYDKGENVAKNIMSLQRETKNKDKYVYNNNNKLWFPKTSGPKIGKEHYRKDSVLNSLRRKARSGGQTENETDSEASSSSMELKDWKTEWKDHWIQKKFEAINSSQPTGDHVNMVAARPWGVPCGDPNQHDMPWGTCMLPMECESEYRIYRGDYLCGRTQFVCCALQLNTYDMYQGFDVSFDDSSLSTDTEEKMNRGKGSKDKKKRKKQRAKRKRKRERQKRKQKIKKNIKKIINEIRKILSRTFRNGTTARKKKTKQLKRFIKELKKQYMNDRQSVKNIHQIEMVNIDAALQKRLNQIKEVNQNFIKNSTFRDIVTKGTISQKGLRMLLQAYPDLANYFTTRRQLNQNHPNDYLDYDIEYGFVYY